MPTPEVNNPTNTLSQELRAREAVAVEDMNKLIDDRIDWSMSNLGDMGIITSNEMKTFYRQKMQELSQEAERLQGELNDREILELQNQIVVNLKKRLSLSLEIAGGSGTQDMVSTPAEMATLKRQGPAVIQNTDVAGLIRDYLVAHADTHPEAAAHYEEKLGRSIRPDTYELLQKTVDGKSLDQKDWAILIDYYHRLYNKDLVGPERTVAISILDSLQPAQRLKLLEQMKQDPILPKLLVDLTSGGYLDKEQVQIFVERHPEILVKNPTLLQDLASPKVKAMQEKMDKVREEIPQRLGRITYGNRNTARELMTFKGIGSTLLAANGAMTVAANVLMEITDPASLLENPCLYLGMAEMGVGLEASKGLAGLAPQPTKSLAKLTANKDEATDDENQIKKEVFSRTFGNNGLEARFYYTFADQIMATYKKKSEVEKTGRPQITVEDLGLKWEDLPEVYRTESKEYLERQISTWAADFTLDWKVLDTGTEKGGQRWEMNQMRKKRGINENYTAELEPKKLLDPKPAKTSR